MCRRLESTVFGAVAAFGVLMSAATAAAQPVTVTVVLKSGARHTGQNLQHRQGQEVSLRKSPQDQLRVSPDEVAYVDFGGTPDAQLTLSGSQEAVVLRNGSVIKGQVLEMAHSSFEDTNTPYIVTIRDENGQERRLPAAQVARVYFRGGAPEAKREPTQPSQRTQPTQPSPSTPPAAGEGFVVPAGQQWTATGLQVRRGETLRVRATGQIQLSADRNDVATPAGARSPRYARRAPMPEVLAGALIGRIGTDGRPFAIGDQTAVPMPDAGELYLGVNDDRLGDNRGEFRVEIQRGTAPRRR